MKIVRVEVERRPLTLRAPYTIAYETVDSVENVFVRVVTDGPHVGLGAAGPDEGVTGETVDACEEALRERAPSLTGADPLARLGLLPAFATAGPAARAAIDMALYDLLGKAAGLPVHRLLGAPLPSMPTSVTVFIEAPHAMVARAKALAAQGFSAIKLKGGRDPQQDAAMVRAVRAAVGPDVALRFDANQGYTEAEALVFLEGIADTDLEVLEQPTPRGRGDALRRVSDASPVPVMADESLIDLADAFRLARGRLAHMVNIKLMKVGGIEAALTVNAVARAAGMEVMVGCMDESALAIAAGLHFALARPNVQLADLDGHLDLLDDPAASAVITRGGRLFPADGPGFGVVDLG